VRLYRLLTTAFLLTALPVSPRTGCAQGFAVTLTGDSIITQRLSVHQPDAKFMSVVNAVRDGDVAFTNLEILFHNYEAPPAAQSGGTWLRAEPALFKDLQWIGFNLFGAANNHSLDYGIEGLRIHRRVLAEAGAAFGGIGENLGEARAPAFLETARGRVALISWASTFSASSPAGAQRPDVRGRPGLNPLRYRTRYRVDAAELAAVRKMKADLKVDAGNVLARTEPDTPERVHFLNQTFELAETPGVITEPDPRDLKGLTEAIGNARRMADYVLVSVHAHEGASGSREVPAQFLADFAHAAVEAGADVFVGHGPHVLRGIEIFKGKVILYSLGNFIFQNDTVTLLPADLYEQYGLGPEALPADLFEMRSDHDRRGFAADPLYWESVIARVAFREGHAAEVRLTPISLGFGRSRWERGRPEAANPEMSAKILGRLQKLSEVFGTKITVREGRGVITVER
jgi:poly-gamma-glutamate synthesis protein (capsule biosynthesis protein)